MLGALEAGPGGLRAVLRPEAASREDREPEHGRERRPAEGKAGSRQEPAKWPEPGEEGGGAGETGLLGGEPPARRQ